MSRETRSIAVSRDLHLFLVMLARLHKTSIGEMNDKVMKLGLVTLLSDEAHGTELLKRQRALFSEIEERINPLIEEFAEEPDVILH